MGKEAGPLSFLPRLPACLSTLSDASFDVADARKEIEEEVTSIQIRLKATLTQVWDENAIFQRIMYKNQNQHRRTIYFRRLMQVRRDLHLLQSFGLQHVVEALPYCVCFSKRKVVPPKVVLTSLGHRIESKESLPVTVQRRLLGGARLLQLMAEPILSASSPIAGLLSQAFFMPFAVTMMAMLARLRVLLVHILYETIAAFNLVSSSMQLMKVSSVPVDIPLYLECSWDGEKIKFFEKLPPQHTPELFSIPTSLSDSTNLPDVGWFTDDRSTLVKEKLHSTGLSEPVLYERDESFILEDSPFELLGEEATETPSIAKEAIPAPSSVTSNVKAVVLSSHEEMVGNSSVEDRAELESWKAELEGWGKPGIDNLVEKSKLDGNSKKRVAYVSVQIGGGKESKMTKTDHQM